MAFSERVSGPELSKFFTKNCSNSSMSFSTSASRSGPDVALDAMVIAIGEVYNMIRRIQETDAEAVAALDAELFPQVCWNENTVRREIKLGWGLVCMDPKGRVIGFLLVRLDGGMADIIRVGVTKKQQGKGHGRALLQDAVDKLSGPIMLTVEKTNETAKHLYLSEGFVPRGQAGDTALILVRDQR